MADVADHFFLAVDQIFEAEDASDDYDDGVDEEEDNFLETLESGPFWSFQSATASTTTAAAAASDVEAVDFGDAGALSPFLESLDSQDFRLYDADEMGSFYLGLELGFDEHQEALPVCQSSGDEVFLFQRSVSHPVSSSELHISEDGQGLRIARFGIDSDTDSEEIVEEDDDIDDDVPPLLWNCLRIEEEVAGDEAEEVTVEDLEWEEVDGRLDERALISMMVGAEEEEDGSSASGSRYTEDEFGESELGDVDVQVVANLDWEVLMAMNHLGNGEGEGNNPSPLMETDDNEVDLANTSGYEVLFGQFLDHISPVNGSPPAAKSIVENLPSADFTDEDIANGKTLCAVCKDEMHLKEKVRRLPCSHLYHGDCILPWLRIRNTCPVCRYELPTDDVEYENWKARRAPGASTVI